MEGLPLLDLGLRLLVGGGHYVDAGGGRDIVDFALHVFVGVADDLDGTARLHGTGYIHRSCSYFKEIDSRTVYKHIRRYCQ